MSLRAKIITGKVVDTRGKQIGSLRTEFIPLPMVRRRRELTETQAVAPSLDSSMDSTEGSSTEEL